MYLLLLHSHSSNLDGFIVNGSSPVAFKFAAKKSIFLVPFLGWSSRWGFDFVAIDRSHRYVRWLRVDNLTICGS